jgi:hypothetical protein
MNFTFAGDPRVVAFETMRVPKATYLSSCCNAVIVSFKQDLELAFPCLLAVPIGAIADGS